MEVNLLARSSGGDPYTVAFRLADGILTIGCDCRAAVFGLACKHRLALAAGDRRMLFDPTATDDLDIAAGWAQSSQLPALLDKVEEAERAVEAAKRVVKDIKRQIGRQMVAGLEPLDGHEA